MPVIPPRKAPAKLRDLPTPESKKNRLPRDSDLEDLRILRIPPQDPFLLADPLRLPDREPRRFPHPRHKANRQRILRSEELMLH
jgi:hypothetical protein